MSRARDLADGTFSGSFSADSPTLVVDDTNNRVGVGTASPNYNFHTATSGSTLVGIERTASGTEGKLVLSSGTSENIIYSQGATSTDNKPLAFYTATTERLRILSTGGITFNGDTAAANALDDYETGSWEPTLVGSSSNPTVTYHADTGGYYVKIGNLLYLTGAIRWSTAFSGGSGSAYIGNLPFTIASRTNGDNSDSLGVARLPAWNGSGTDSPNAVKGNQNTTTLTMSSIKIGSVSKTVSITDLGSNCMINFTVIVHTP